MLGDPFRLVFPADHEAADILKEQQGDAALAGEFDKMRPLLRAFRKQHAVIGQDRDRHPPDMGEAAYQRAAVLRLEFVEFAAVHQPRDDFVHIVRRADVLGDQGVEILRIEFGRTRLFQRHILCRSGIRAEMRHDIAHDGERVFVVFGEVVDHA